jgi:hypothetical protein
MLEKGKFFRQVFLSGGLYALKEVLTMCGRVEEAIIVCCVIHHSNVAGVRRRKLDNQ